MTGKGRNKYNSTPDASEYKTQEHNPESSQILHVTAAS